ncbi:hypothetical protein SGRI78S_03615 [Streptomyces griseus subsp. griseus]
MPRSRGVGTSRCSTGGATRPRPARGLPDGGRRGIRGERLLAEEGTHSGRVAYAGDLTGTVEPATAPRFDEDAAAPYTGLRPQLTEASRCYAYDGDEHREATGTWVKTGDVMTFTGDGSSAIQIFDVDADLESEAGGNTGFVFNGIPEGATVLVNVYGSTRSVASFAGALPNEGLRENLLWNFPDATDLTMSGPAQFDGSVLVGQPTSTTVLSMSGTNGRFYTAGSLTHTSSGASGGQEIHAYPFDGDLPSCSPEPTPTPTEPTPTPTPTEPTPTPTEPTPTPTEPTPTPTEPTPTPTEPTPTPTEPTPTPTEPTPTPTEPTPTPTEPTPTPTEPTPTPTEPTPTGPEAFTLAEAADELSRVTGRPVVYVPETREEAYASRAGYGAEDWEVAGWVTSYEAIANGELSAVSDAVPALTGHPAKSFAQFLVENPDSYRHLLAGG